MTHAYAMSHLSAVKLHRSRTAERDHRPISQHKVAGSVGARAAQQQQPLKPHLSFSCRCASEHCIVRSVAVFVAGRALDGPVVCHVVCARARSARNSKGSSGVLMNSINTHRDIADIAVDSSVYEFVPLSFSFFSLLLYSIG